MLSLPKSMSQMTKGVVLGAVVSTLVLVGSSAIAGTSVGKVLHLGKSNKANATTTLRGSTNGAQLQVTNTNSGAAARGLKIKTKQGVPPLAVSSTAKVKGLNADRLDGLDAADLQRHISGTCQNGRALIAVGVNGGVTCSDSAIYPLALSSATNEGATLDLAPSHLTIDAHCGSNSEIKFTDGGSDAATLNWDYSMGGSPPDFFVSGDSIAGGGTKSFLYNGERLEGQFIYSEPGAMVTVSLHSFDGGTACEVSGTAQVALTG